MSMKPIRTALLYVLICFVLMSAVFIAIIETGDGPWRATEATVVDSRIESKRPGTLQWVLEVDFTYVVDGREYGKSTLDVFSSPNRPDTEAQQPLWPEGHVFTVYTSPKNPEAYSFARDGDREALAVLASLLVPIVVALLWMAAVARRRRSIGSFEGGGTGE